jgi:hypothetical protein
MSAEGCFKSTRMIFKTYFDVVALNIFLSIEIMDVILIPDFFFLYDA